MKSKYITVYFDMDGVLAKWDPNAKTEDTYKKDYFLYCEEEKVVTEVINILKEKYTVKILSHAYGKNAIDAKNKWLDKIGLTDIDRIFVPYGNKKSNYINKDETNVIIDDYTKNLNDWQKDGNIAIKFRNRINGTKGTWTGPSVKYDMSVKEIVDKIENIIN